MRAALLRPLVLAMLFVLLNASGIQAQLIIDSAVFAHDFERIVGDTIIPAIGSNGMPVGPNAAKTSNIAANSTDPRPAFGRSLQHVQAPPSHNINFVTINTDTRLMAATSALSFSIFYNARGDTGSPSAGPGQVIFLSAFDGFNSVAKIFAAVQSINNPQFGTGRRLLFSYNTMGRLDTYFDLPSTGMEIPDGDSIWHQAGVVYQGGATDGIVTFYFDGVQRGAPVAAPKLAQIPVLPEKWHLIGNSQSSSDVYFRNGDYDDAALWYRALSPQEMSALHTHGINALPEPSAFVLCSLAAAAGGIWRWRMRKRVEPK